MVESSSALHLKLVDQLTRSDRRSVCFAAQFLVAVDDQVNTLIEDSDGLIECFYGLNLVLG
jgi:hypothetical protein